MINFSGLRWGSSPNYSNAVTTCFIKWGGTQRSSDLFRSFGGGHLLSLNDLSAGVGSSSVRGLDECCVHRKQRQHKKACGSCHQNQETPHMALFSACLTNPHVLEKLTKIVPTCQACTLLIMLHLTALTIRHQLVQVISHLFFAEA